MSPNPVLPLNASFFSTAACKPLGTSTHLDCLNAHWRMVAPILTTYDPKQEYSFSLEAQGPKFWEKVLNLLTLRR